jgi:hypothetical protein
MTLQEFLLRWPTWCEEHGVAWGEPKLCEESCGMVVRWHGPRVSVRAIDVRESFVVGNAIEWRAMQAAVVDLLDWQTAEHKADWLGLVFFADHDVERVCERVSDEIGNAIPW